MNHTCPLVSDCAVELEGSVIVIKFLVFIRDCENNELQYYICVFIFLFNYDEPIFDNS